MPTAIGSERGEELLEEGIRTVVRTGMESPYRDAIIEGIEEADQDLIRTKAADDSTEDARPSTGRKVAKGTGIFIVAMILIYAFYRSRGE